MKLLSFAEVVVAGEGRLHLWVVDIETEKWTTTYLNSRPILVDEMPEVMLRGPGALNLPVAR